MDRAAGTAKVSKGTFVYFNWNSVVRRDELVNVARAYNTSFLKSEDRRRGNGDASDMEWSLDCRVNSNRDD
jgi:hypothetical protein